MQGSVRLARLSAAAAGLNQRMLLITPQSFQFRIRFFCTILKPHFNQTVPFLLLLIISLYCVVGKMQLKTKECQKGIACVTQRTRVQREKGYTS